MTRKPGLFIGVLAIAICAPAAAQDAVQGGFSDIRYLLNWRVRYEGVDQAGFAEDASALTSRVRAGIETGTFANTRLLAEGVVVSDLIDDYNSTTNGNTAYPVVADPAGFGAINRLALINDSLDNTTLTLGRQRLILDDARFIGNVGWRQNEQTYDGLSSHTQTANYTIDLGWFNQVNRIFGPDSPNGEWEGDIFALNASRTFGFGKLTGFAYAMEFDQAAGASNETVGLQLTGSKALEAVSLIYTLSVASQSDAGQNPADYSETYTKIEGGITHGGLTVALGQEVLGGDGSAAFATPLATLHAFQGWGDKFLGTPSAGIIDSYLRFAYAFGQTGVFDSLSLTGFYHDFEADFGSAQYGDEIDLALAARTGRFALTLKYASYSADTFRRYR